MQSSFLTTKLRIPNPGVNLVDRPRLSQALDQCHLPNKRLTILSAPAGYGKTTLATAWIRRAGDTIPALKTAWLSLDAGDNDAVRFWSYFVLAVQRADAQVGREALALLAAPGGRAHEMALISLINDLAESGAPWVVALDDFHLIEETSIHRTLAHLIDRLPEQCHLLVLTRSDPPWPLPLMRGRGQLLEIRQDDLCFRDEEASSLLVDCLKLDLSPEAIQLLNAKTEGWASGLQLAAVSLEGQKDRAKFIGSFSGTNRYILDYLVGEVLEHQALEVRQFLLKTSILEVLSAPLCAAVVDLSEAEAGVQSGTSDLVVRTQALLEHLLKSNLFVIALDEERTSFRYHHLFADLLRRQLLANHPELLRPLHARASAWYEQQGLLEQAMRHALTGNDYERSIRLLDEGAEALWARGEHTTLQRLIQALPDSYRQANPLLLVYEAGSLAVAGRLREAERCLEAVERCMAGPMPDSLAARQAKGRAAAVWVQIAAYRGDAGAALEYAQIASEHLPPDETAWSSRYAMSAGNALLMAGRFGEAREQLARGMRAGLEGDSPWVYLSTATMLGMLAWSQGRLGEAQRLMQEARSFLQSHDLGSVPISRGIAVIEGILLLEQGRLDEAEALIRRALEVALPVEGSANVSLGYLGMVLCCLSRGDWHAAEEHIRNAELSMQRHHYPIWIECALAGIKARVLIRQGRLDEAEAYLHGRRVLSDGQITYPHQNEYLALAVVLVRQRRFEAATDLIDRLEHFCESSEMRMWLIPAGLLRAQLSLADGRVDDARAALGSAWRLALALGHYQDFVQLDSELRPLLGEPDGLDEAPELIRRMILQAQDGVAPAHSSLPGRAGLRPQMPGEAPGEALAERLSERELEVLRLVAAGLSNKEIAQRLHVELQTVKFHTGNIYGKLAVENRVQAVNRAQQLGILP